MRHPVAPDLEQQIADYDGSDPKLNAYLHRLAVARVIVLLALIAFMVALGFWDGAW